jgi:hypothetical protein
MRRFIAPAVLALVLSLAVAGPAAAKTKSYAGNVGGGGVVGFNLKKKNNGKKSVKNFTFLEVPIECAEGANTASGELTFKMKVVQRQFSGTAESDSGGQLEVEGTVNGGGSNGTLRVFGSVPLDSGATGTDCDTGTRDWNANKL